MPAAAAIAVESAARVATLQARIHARLAYNLCLSILRSLMGSCGAISVRSPQHHINMQQHMPVVPKLDLASVCAKYCVGTHSTK